MKKTLFILLFLPALSHAQTEVLEQFFTKMEQHTLQADFTLTMEEDAAQPISYNGNILMRGEQFYLTMWDMEVAYDGTTLYTYMDDAEELTLSTPTRQEITETNPLLFAKALLSSCQVRYGKANNTNGLYVIELVPDNREAGIQKFILHLRTVDLLPVSAQMKESATKTVTLLLRNAQYTDALPRCSISKPEAFINDLR